MIDSFGVRLTDFNSNFPTASQNYENFYDENNNEDFYYYGREFLYNFHLC